MNSLPELGWNPYFEALFSPFAENGFVPGRVAQASRERYRVLTARGETTAELAGRLRHQAEADGDLPCVGDWVVLGAGVVHAVLERRTELARKRAGRGSAREVVAANLDSVFLVTSLDRDLNPRRLERGLALVWDGGASPVILLSKADLAGPAEVAEAAASVEEAAPAVPVHVVSATTGEGLASLAAYLGPGRTVALVGSSGVGKSTLLNRMARAEREATTGVRESDGRGRHTTTRRHLVPLPDGGLLVDTPGLRELGLTGDEDLTAVFGDVEALAAGCRFRDCSHRAEPGCAVREALPPERLESFRKLAREAEWAALRREHSASYAEKRRWKKLMSLAEKGR